MSNLFTTILAPKIGSKRLKMLNKYLWNEWLRDSNHFYQNSILCVAFNTGSLKVAPLQKPDIETFRAKYMKR